MNVILLAGRDRFTGNLTMSKYPRCPSKIKGTLEISKSRNGVFIGGDPEGLRSLAKILDWLADINQENHPNMPDGEREHVHLYCDPALPQAQLTPFSANTELCRLDAKGTGEFPRKYHKPLQKRVRKQNRKQR